MPPRRTTVVAFGITGHGKSEFLNAYLQKWFFTVSDDPKSCTVSTSWAENIVSLDLRTGIDTQGLDDSEGIDAANVQQMVSFLKAWPYGVNAFALVINGQSSRFDQGTQRFVKILDSFFNDSTFWNHVCVVFTKWFSGMAPSKKETLATKYRQEVLKVVHQLIGNATQTPRLPVFFVNSPEWRREPDTEREIGEFHRFAKNLNPLPTVSISPVNIQFWRVTIVRRNGVLVDTRFSGRTRTQMYEDQERERRIGYDGRTITYSNWRATQRWDVVKSSSVQTETRTTCISENRRPVFRLEPCGHRRWFGIVGPRDGRRQVRDHDEVTHTYQTKEREIETDFDGEVTYGEWRVVRTWTE
jgi:hypothetical protein